MKLKDWLKKTNKKLGDYDLKHIDYEAGRYGAGPYKGQIWYNTVSEEQIGRFPLLLECDVIQEKEYDSEYILASFTSLNCGSGKCKQYSCRLDADQVKIAFKHRGVKSLWVSYLRTSIW